MYRVVHFEIMAAEPERVGKFYADVFGWWPEKSDGPEDYWTLKSGDKSTPGINGSVARTKKNDAGVTVNSIEVPSIDQFVEKIAAQGGKVTSPKITIPDVGYFAYCEDTEGNPFGIIQFDSTAT